MREAQQSGSPRPKLSRVEVYWHSVSYRTLALYILLFVSVVLAVMYSVSPGLFTGALDRLDHMVGNPSGNLRAIEAGPDSLR